MITFPDYRLYSFTVGCKHTRAFAVDATAGIIDDYILGECGAKESPLPERFYDKVGFGTGMTELTGARESRRIACNRDNIVLSERTLTKDLALPDPHASVLHAKHLFPDILELMKTPKTNFLGYVWQYIRIVNRPRSRFDHPAAQVLSTALLKINLAEKEIPATCEVRIDIRSRLSESMLKKGLDDYLNVILTFQDLNISGLWDQEENLQLQQEEPRAISLTIDVQRVFEPKRTIDEHIFDEHWRCCNEIVSPRIIQIIEEAGFGKSQD